MDQAKFSTGADDDELDRILTPEVVQKILQFATLKLQSEQVREDYQYFLQLVILFVGGKLDRFHFRPPMALSSARFMGRIINCLTMYMFCKGGQFQLDETVLSGIREVNVFTVTTYLEPWFTATDPVKAPLTDLLLLKDIMHYSAVSPLTAECALNAFKGHMWYLSEECVALAFFDDRVPISTKRAMVLNLGVQKKATYKSRMKYVVGQKDNMYDLIDKDLDFFVSKHTLKFFEYLRIDSSFLSADPATWHTLPSNIQALETVKGLQVVNDIAERGVALIKSYSACEGKVTNDETELQKIIVVCRKLIMEETPKDMTIKGVMEKIKDKMNKNSTK
ncbi:Uridine 5'-monophosphate synthase [Frankliniella fusca]|uniref:Uridine 5'-monophosphate synthase n=1 Tax=Frankliniella fusca TaxID=407009 RepID=A0AAE1HNG4_9NEOP|nr:Uridine 5'-monophosphate synthase [Frankliniella fusca]